MKSIIEALNFRNLWKNKTSNDFIFECEDLIKEHIIRVKDEYIRYDEFLKKIDTLLKPDVLKFCSYSIHENIKNNLLNYHNSYKKQKFQDLHIAINTIDISLLKILPNAFENDYSNYVDKILNYSDFSKGNIDFAHWIFCFNSNYKPFQENSQSQIHLSFYMSINSGNYGMSLLAHDFLTEKEKREFNLCT